MVGPLVSLRPYSGGVQPAASGQTGHWQSANASVSASTGQGRARLAAAAADVLSLESQAGIIKHY